MATTIRIKFPRTGPTFGIMVFSSLDHPPLTPEELEVLHSAVIIDLDPAHFPVDLYAAEFDGAPLPIRDGLRGVLPDPTPNVTALQRGKICLFPVQSS